MKPSKIHAVRPDMKRAFVSCGFLLSCTLVFFILLRSLAYYNVLNNTLELDRLFLLTIPMSLSGFTPFAAIFPLLPYATSFCDEYNSGYVKNIVTRVGLGKYIKTKIISVGLSGALAIGVPFFIIFILITIIGAPTTAGNLSEAYIGKIWESCAPIGGGTLVLAAKLLLGLLFGSVWALVGLAISAWFTNRYVTIVGPFVLYQGLWILLANLPINPLYMLRGDFGRPGEFIGSYIYILFYQIIWISILVIITAFGIRRRIKNV